LTLYHWDLPQELEDAGGWPVRETADRFAEYAVGLHDALGDRVNRWTTLNEPWCSAFLGYASGNHAPGRTEPEKSFPAMHHLLLGHGMAARELAARGAQVGITLNLYAISAAGDSDADRDAARRIDGLANRVFLDPVLLGTYPEDVKADVAGLTDWSFVQDGDLATISTPLAMLGVNYYSRHVVSGEPAEADEPYWRKPTAWPGSEHVRFTNRPGVPRTAMDWEIDAPGLREVLDRVAADYPGIPMYITENGAAFDDKLDAEGFVHDPERIDYLRGHLQVCVDAAAAGIPLRGYFAWSLMDNFEWAWGYTRRFGLVYVDYADEQRRVPKDSATWYASLIHNR
jgi:beta-glucosidase